METETKLETKLETKPLEVIGNQNLIFESLPESPGTLACRFEGCIVGGFGASEEEAFRNFVRYINRLALVRDVVGVAVAAADNRVGFPPAVVDRYSTRVNLDYL